MARFSLPHKFIKDMATRVNFKAIEDFFNDTSVVNVTATAKEVVADPVNLPPVADYAGAEITEAAATAAATAKAEAIAAAVSEAADYADGMTISTDRLVAGTALIGSALIASLDAGKIVTGTLDASLATITNLNADNIETGTLSAIALSGCTITGGVITAGTAGNGRWEMSSDATVYLNGYSGSASEYAPAHVWTGIHDGCTSMELYSGTMKDALNAQMEAASLRLVGGYTDGTTKPYALIYVGDSSTDSPVELSVYNDGSNNPVLGTSGDLISLPAISVAGNVNAVAFVPSNYVGVSTPNGTFIQDTNVTSAKYRIVFNSSDKKLKVISPSGTVYATAALS